MKKICICTTVSLTMKSFVVPTACYLHEQCGYDITLICNPDEAFEKSLPEYIHFIPVNMARGIDWSAPGSIRAFYKIFKKEKFDLVQYSTPNASCYASIAAKLCKAPIRLYCQWGIRYVGLSGISRKIFKTIEKSVCRNSSDIRAVSEMNKAFAVEEGLYPEQKAKVIGKGGTIGVDLASYDIQQKTAWRQQTREQYGLAAEDFVFGFCGRVSADKGCAELIASFKGICQHNPCAKLLLVGSFEEGGIDAALMEWANKSESVIFTGSVPNNEMKYYYAAMDCLVHPTYREGFGMVLQEAGALGLAVITTDIPGASEVMEKNVSCLLVEPKNTQALESAMKHLAEQPAKAQALGEAAYQRTKMYFDRKIMLENQRRDYEALINREEIR